MVRHSEKHLIIILHPSSLSHNDHLNVEDYCIWKKLESLKVPSFAQICNQLEHRIVCFSNYSIGETSLLLVSIITSNV